MVKLYYTYRGAPLTPYRPQRKKGPGKFATGLIIVLIVGGLLYGAWHLYSSTKEKQQTVDTPAVTLNQQINPVPEKPAVVKPAETIKVAAAPNRELPPDQAAFDRKITQLIETAQYEDARGKLEKCLTTIAVTHPYYERAQELLAFCSAKMHSRGDFKRAYIEYTVKSGDVLGKIAGRYRTTINAIVKTSELTNQHSLRIGQVLRIPQNCWSAKLDTAKKKLFLYHTDKLVRVYSLNGTLPTEKGPLEFDPDNESFWTACGLNDTDLQSLKSMIPAKTVITCE